MFEIWEREPRLRIMQNSSKVGGEVDVRRQEGMMVWEAAAIESTTNK